MYNIDIYKIKKGKAMEINMTNKISFPALGWEFNISSVAFNVFGKDIHWYALIILTGFMLAVGYCMWKAKKQKINPDYIFDIALYGLIIGIICARIYYVLFDLKSFRENPLDVFKIWEGGLAIYGGIFGGILTAYVYSKIKKLNVLQIFDIGCQGLFIGQAVGRYGNFFNTEVYGGETTLFTGMSINGGPPVHPLFFYESCWNILGLILVMIFEKKKKAHGQVFYFYCLWYSLGRIFLEGMRQPEYVLYAFGNVGISQIVAGLFIVFAVVMLIKSSIKENVNE